MEHERGAGHTAPSPAPAPAPARAPASQLEAPPRRRPPCAGCGQEIARSRDAYRIEALGKVYHIRCFRCTVCEGDFDESRPFVPHDGQAYCEEDYQRVLETRCAGCNKSISGKPVYALGKPWHQEHLKCCACRKPVRGKVFESEGRIYCEEDYQALVAETCRGCGTPVQGETINALNSTYHKECFVCTTCRQPFQGRRFYVFDNDPVCLLHYHERNNSLCGGCQTGIEGPCADIPELGKRFHQECWCCALCQASLMDSYYSFEGRAYCEKDIAKVYRAETPGQRANKRQTLLLNL
ncbi:uncharacterized protein EV422DRAFT_496891 [Fimicolochytrium jonesii]|uniref:uncharacterized protein n=1 Tax=Fimicolochytrium jonesii TaxID=1396493 RepID=UPI0022FE7002|nr:uncharacterized protein EV422DRAFT_496891 [Fimicolochytrium jonesii]KAI8820590.1 hypothetical protein EV422DRAFT_496891 [Fimicolochytrium jonesii]